MRQSTVHTALTAATVVIALLTSACSGNRPGTGVGGGAQTVSSGSRGLPAEDHGPASLPSSRNLSASVASGAASTAIERKPTAGTAQTTVGGFSYKAADLFSASQDRVGITATTITLCMHWPEVFAPAFKDLPKDFPVYWQWLNDHGGIYGRRVNLVITDDQYSPSGGVQAAQQCASNNPAPFLITGFAGIDTAPAVRQWAEANHWLYLSPFSTDSGLSKLRYTFEIQPSIEDVGDVLGRYVAKHWPGGSDGVVWRNTSNWQGGRDHFEAIVKARGARITDLPISENQGNYTNEVLALKAARAKSVLAVMNPTELIQLEKQAAEQNYYPRWINATLDLTTDAIGSDIDGSRGPAAIGFWFVPEYHNGDATEPWSPEERAMEAAYHTYDSSHTPNDIDWFNWLTFKQLGRMLRDCGRDCTRNKIAGMFLAGYRTTVNPLCPVDFARGHGKIGSFAMNIAEVVRRTSGVGWQQVESCRDRF